MKKILIIGGSYFFGRVFVETLLKNAEWEISILNRGKIPFRNPSVKEIVCDRQDETSLLTVLKPAEWDAVVDFCAYQASDIRLMLKVLNHSAIGRYIFISTASVYNEQEPDSPLSEEEPLLASPLPPGMDYGNYVWNKRQTESELVSRCAETSTDWTILRPAIIFGKFNYAPRESYFFDKIIAGEEITIPDYSISNCKEHRYSFVSVWDAATLILKCLEQAETAGKCFNLAAPEQINYEWFIESLATATGRTPDVKKISVEELFRRQIPLPFPPDRSLLYNGSAVARLLGFSYSLFDRELARTWKYYLAGRGIDPETLQPL